MAQSIIKEKSFHFAVDIIKASEYLQNEKKEFLMSKQLRRSGTSIGANVREAINAESKRDFIHKLAIAQKECDEVIYRLELLNTTDYIEDDIFKELK